VEGGATVRIQTIGEAEKLWGDHGKGVGEVKSLLYEKPSL